MVQVRDEGASALLAQRASLDAAHDSDRALLLREVTELTARLDALRALAARDAADADARVEAVKGAVGSEVEGAVGIPVSRTALHQAYLVWHCAAWLHPDGCTCQGALSLCNTTGPARWLSCCRCHEHWRAVLRPGSCTPPKHALPMLSGRSTDWVPTLTPCKRSWHTHVHRWGTRTTCT